LTRILGKTGPAAPSTPGLLATLAVSLARSLPVLVPHCAGRAHKNELTTQEKHAHGEDAVAAYLSPRLVCPLPPWQRGVAASDVWGYSQPGVAALLADPSTLALTRWTPRQGWVTSFMRQVGRLYWGHATSVSSAEAEALQLRLFLGAEFDTVARYLKGAANPLLLDFALVEARAVLEDAAFLRKFLTCCRADAVGIVTHCMVGVLKHFNDGVDAYPLLEIGLARMSGDPERAAEVVRLCSPRGHLCIRSHVGDAPA